jgi:type IV secretory pathway VirB9-like protein
MGEMRASYRYGEYDKLQAIKTGAKIKKMGGKRGIADLILIYDKRTIYLEIKTEKGKQSKEQKEFQEICKKNNQPYFVVRNVDEVAKIVNKIGEGVDNKKLIN